MPLDPRINMMAQPVKTAGPLDQMNVLLGLQGGINKNRLIELQMQQAKQKMEAAPDKAKLEMLLKMIQLQQAQTTMQKTQGDMQDAQGKRNAMAEYANLMQTGGVPANDPYGPPSGVAQNEQIALQQMQEAMARGDPNPRIAVPNQGRLQSLMMQIDPRAGVAGAMKQMNPGMNQGQDKPYTLSPGAIRYDASGRQISAAPFAPRNEPAPTVRAVPDASSKTGFSYQDMRNPGSALAPAPAPQVSAKKEEEDQKKEAAAQYAEMLAGRLEQLLSENPRSVTGTFSAPVRGFESLANAIAPGSVGSEATIASQTKEQLINIMAQIRGGGMGRLSNQDMRRVDAAIGQINSGTQAGMAQGIKDVYDTIDILRGRPARSAGATGSFATPPSSGGWSIKQVK